MRRAPKADSFNAAGPDTPCLVISKGPRCTSPSSLLLLLAPPHARLAGITAEIVRTSGSFDLGTTKVNCKCAQRQAQKSLESKNTPNDVNLLVGLHLGVLAGNTR